MKYLSISILLLLSVSARADPALLRLVDFETGDLAQLPMQKAQEDSITIVSSPVRFGEYAARTILRSTDPKVSKGQRAEFSDRTDITKIEMGKEYWYGLSIFLPQEFVAPTKKDAVLFQWHTQQGGPSPVLAIRVRKGEWFVSSDATEKRRTLLKAPFVKSRWTDWVVQVRWSADKTGFWTIWKDGVEVVAEQNIVTQYPESLGPYAKFGQYHSVEEVPGNVVYFDEYRVAGPGGNYEMVAPPGKSVSGEK